MQIDEKLLVTFPNEGFESEIYMKSAVEFEPTSELSNVLFGWIDKEKSLYISITRNEYEKLLNWKYVNNF